MPGERGRSGGHVQGLGEHRGGRHERQVEGPSDVHPVHRQFESPGGQIAVQSNSQSADHLDQRIVVDGRKVVFAINRKQLNGVMQARVPDGNSMIVTVSVRVDKQMVPVIGMNLKRVDASEVGAIAKN